MNKLVSLLIVISLSACYYDNEEELYPNLDCTTKTISFSSDISPIINTKCATTGCHVQGGSGSGIFENYNQIKAKVDNGSFRNRVIIQKDMPPSSSLTNCQITYI